jgi:hypothetical protein
MDWLKQNVPALHGAISDASQKVSQVAQKVAPGVTTDSAAVKATGAAPELSGKTITGGRRYKTKRGGKRRKTHRRRGGGNCPIKCPKTTDGVHKFGRSVNLGDVTESQCTLCKCVKSV